MFEREKDGVGLVPEGIRKNLGMREENLMPPGLVQGGMESPHHLFTLQVPSPLVGKCGALG